MRIGRDTSGSVTRQEIDDALRSTDPLPDRIAERVRSLDAVLDVKPTPESLVVTLLPSSARIPSSLVPGVTVTEPSYLTSFLAGSDTTFASEPLVVKLRVPEGTPAMYVDPAVPSGPGTLLLARGIEWRVDRVVPADHQTLVTAHVASRSPKLVPANRPGR